VEWLRHKSLSLACTGHSELIVLRELIHTQDSDDILETLVVLEELLGGAGGLVVDLTNHTGVKHAAGGIEGIHSGVDT
jgi:hypothetical protein